jgi:hypothetical protein
MTENSPIIENKQTSTAKRAPEKLQSLMSINMENRLPLMDIKMSQPNEIADEQNLRGKQPAFYILPPPVMPPIKKNPVLETIMANRNKKRFEHLKRVHGNDPDVQDMLFDRVDLLIDMHMLMNYDFCNKYPKKKTKKVKQKPVKNVEPVKTQHLIDVEDGEVNENDENAGEEVMKKNVVVDSRRNDMVLSERPTHSPSHRKSRHEETKRGRNNNDYRKSTDRDARDRRSRSRSRNRSQCVSSKRSREKRSRSRSRSRANSRSSYLTQSSNYSSKDNRSHKPGYNKDNNSNNNNKNNNSHNNRNNHNQSRHENNNGNVKRTRVF